jgi:hypothetical protein
MQAARICCMCQIHPVEKSVMHDCFTQGTCSFQSQNVYLNPETTSLHWKFSLRSARGQYKHVPTLGRKCKMQDARCKVQGARCKKSEPGSVEALKANRGEMEALGVDVMMPSTYGSSSVSRYSVSFSISARGAIWVQATCSCPQGATVSADTE